MMNIKNHLQLMKWLRLWTKLVFILLIAVVCIYIFCWDNIHTEPFGEKELLCYEITGNKLPELDEKEPKLGKGIYFHESSCPSNRSNIGLNARQSCSIESALRAHFDTDVFLLISAPIVTPLEKTSNIFVQQLMNYPNFKLRHITYSKYLSDTPLNVIRRSGALNYSRWPVHHASDVLRYATLYKFGGVYLDLDVLVLKPLMQLKNFAGLESNESLGADILGFSFDHIGREVATECAIELARTYKARKWGSNGPGVITRVMKRRCKTFGIYMTKSPCGGFRVFPKDYFHAISYKEPVLLFQEGNLESVNKIVNKSYTIHYWNKFSSSLVLEDKLDIPYINYARRYCPKIYEAAKGNFN